MAPNSNQTHRVLCCQGDVYHRQLVWNWAAAGQALPHGVNKPLLRDHYFCALDYACLTIQKLRRINIRDNSKRLQAFLCRMRAGKSRFSFWNTSHFFSWPRCTKICLLSGQGLVLGRQYLLQCPNYLDRDFAAKLGHFVYHNGSCLKLAGYSSSLIWFPALVQKTTNDPPLTSWGAPATKDWSGLV